MMYLLTPEVHAQIVASLEATCGGRCNAEYNPCWEYELADKIKAMKPATPCDKQFQSREGTWYGFHNDEHYKNTLSDGSWPIREVYTIAKEQQ